MNKLFKHIAGALLTLGTLTSQAQFMPSTCQHTKAQNAAVLQSGGSYAMANNSRSDTVNILKYTISLQITDFTNKVIKGNTQVKFTPKMNGLNILNLDLLELTIDSIKIGSVKLTYGYNDTLLRVNLGSTKNIGDTSVVTVFYGGKPQLDGSWGGFYWNGGYAFNLGVAFTSLPHNFGRVWFPCFDNFVERSKYEFFITTATTKASYCNGFLKKDTTISGLRQRNWVMNEEIPSYLACVAVADYTQINWSYNGINGTIPITLAALPADTTKLKASFVNLKSALAAYEARYGAYMWNKVGYSLVPFNGGAMEHATNIAYPTFANTGSITYEGTMAHELSHHWWGDLATCKTAQEMWINEGWASYSEYIFTEWMYGKAAAKANMKALHENVVHYSNYKEGGYLALNNIPLQYTYGDHVYNKGSVVAHTLRGYMGDSLFFKGTKAFMANNQYKDVTSVTLRDDMANATGYNLTDFFNGWVMNGGFPAFSVDSFRSVPNGSNFDVTVYIRQKLHGASSYFNNVPIEVTYKYANWGEVIKTVMVNGQNSNFTFTLPMKPVYVGLNIDEKIGEAVTSDTKVIKTTGNHFVYNANGRMALTVNTLPDSAFIRTEHHYAAPDPIKGWGKPYKISNYHYWKIDGIIPAGFKATAKVYYDGRTGSTGGGGYWLDHTLIGASEDSVVLMYRKNTADDWVLFPYYTKSMFSSTTDKFGSINIDSLWLGEYTIAIKDFLSGTGDLIAESSNLNVYPNPSSSDLSIEWTAISKTVSLLITDLSGRTVYKEELKPGVSSLKLKTSLWKNGTYLLSLHEGAELVGRNKFMVSH